MSIASVGELDNRDSLVGMVEGIGEFVEQAATERASPREFEREIFDRLLKMGHAATEQFLPLQGDGDRGETVADGDSGRCPGNAPPPRPAAIVLLGRLPATADLNQPHRPDPHRLVSAKK